MKIVIAIDSFKGATSSIQAGTAIEKGQYGTTLMGMLGVRTEDFKKGPWWLYDSDNNTSCKEKGQCDAIDILQVNDQDQFTFHFTSSF